MENYCKGKNVEEPFERDKIPFENLLDNFLWMQVRGGSKMRNLLPHALNELPTVRNVIWTGFGTSVGKAISCAEIMKREHQNKLHQITRICYRRVEEHWDPLIEDLDPLVVRRRLPMIHIWLSLDKLDVNAIGYQAPNSKLHYLPKEQDNRKHNNNKGNKKKHSQNPNNKIQK